MKTTEAIILAGGFGTRLKHIIHNVPKPMVPINGIPFLSFLLKQISNAGIKHVVLSTGFLHEKIEFFYKNSFENMTLSYAQEKEPLGTGGAIMFSLEKTTSNQVLVFNGDTFFDIDFEYFDAFAQTKKNMLTVALRNVDNVSRFGTISINKTNKIISFSEKKQSSGQGLINGGIYLLNKEWLLNLNLPKAFSFEKEVLEKLFKEYNFYGLTFDKYFIDIGMPDDYKRAQIELTYVM